MKVNDDYYPTIRISSEAWVFKSADGFRWKIKSHISGPDDVCVSESGPFKSKQNATISMLTRYLDVVSKQMEELGDQ